MRGNSRRKEHHLRSWVFVLLLPAHLGAQSRITYEADCRDAARGRVQVRIVLPEPAAGPRPFVFPRAVPMGYGEQPFDRFVMNLRAFSRDRRALAVARIEGPRWIVGGRDDRVASVEYEVDIERMEREILSAADSSRARAGYLSLLGYTVFGFLEGTEARPVRLRIAGPAGWPLFSTLDPRAPPARSAAAATARDFYALADSQILMGPDLEIHRLRASVPLFLALYAEGPLDRRLLARTAEEAFAAVAAYFGSVPFAHYTVCQEYLRPLSERHDYGFSMEHLESGTFFFRIDQGLTEASSAAEVARVRYNLAHHIAHAWIPKRAYGEGYFPFRWDSAPVIETIWFSEGFAQYAALEALADRMPDEEAHRYREQVVEARFGAALREAPDFIRKLSLIDLSRLASTRYSQDFRIGRSVFSRGALMALEMDEHLRKVSAGRVRLRDALRRLVAWSARSGRAFRIEELPHIFRQATGVDTRSILERWLPAPGEVMP